jgi:Signal peptidase (SPase) II
MVCYIFLTGGVASAANFWEWRGIKFYSYPLLLYLGTLVGIYAATYGAGRRGLDPGRVYLAMLLLFPVGLVARGSFFSSSRTGAFIGVNLTGSGSFFQHPAARLGLGLALGGAGSNIHDRLSRGAVLDFLELG